MNYPTLKVGNTHWQVEAVRNFTSTSDSEGQTHHSAEMICIHEGLPHERARQVLIHEMLHVCADFVGIKDDERLSEEEYVSRIAPVLTMVLMDNPWVVNKPMNTNMSLRQKLDELSEQERRS